MRLELLIEILLQELNIPNRKKLINFVQLAKNILLMILIVAWAKSFLLNRYHSSAKTEYKDFEFELHRAGFLTMGYLCLLLKHHGYFRLG